MRLPVSLNEATCRITEAVSSTNTPPMTSATTSWRTITAITPMRAADRQRADIAHEYLRGIRVEPQEAQPRAGERRAENQELARSADLRNLQIVREHGVAARVREDAQRRRHQRGGHDGQPVEPVGEIHRVAHADDHQIRRSR